MSVNIKENGQLVKTAGLNSQTVIIDNLTTQDSTKALSAKQGYVLNQNKVDKVAGKGLSTNDYTNEEKTKLAGIVAGAEPNVQSDWKQSDSSSDDFIKNKPTSEIQTSDDGQFTTVTGGLMQKCVVDLEPIQSGSGTPSPSNVRAISGHTQVQVGNCGKNKLPLTVSGIKSINTSGTWSGNVYSINSGTFEILVDSDNNVIGIKINGTFTANTPFYLVATGTSVLSPYLVSGTEYIMNGVPSGTNTVRLDIEYNGSWKTLTTDSTTFTYTSGGEDRFRIYAPANSSASNSVFYPMIRLATETDATYEPYNGYTTTINLGGTYYGGTLDAVSGVLTVTHALYSDTWGNGSSATDLGSVTRKTYDFLSVGTSKNDENSIMNCAPYNNSWSGNYLHYAINASTHQTLYLFLPNGTSSDFVFQLCFELATPQTIQLDPQTLETLVGQNDVFAPLDGQTVEEVEFREVLAWDDVEKEIEVLLDDKANVTNIGTVEGETASKWYFEGELFYKDGYVCRVKVSSVPSGTTWTLGTNYERTDLATILENLEDEWHIIASGYISDPHEIAPHNMYSDWTTGYEIKVLADYNVVCNYFGLSSTFLGIGLSDTANYVVLARKIKGQSITYYDVPIIIEQS